MKNLFIILLGCVSISAIAQDEAIKNIREHYNSIGKQIDACNKKTEEVPCSLYSNLNLTNAGNNEWRGSGNYKKEVQFWYNDSPRNCDKCGKEGINVLQKVIISEQVATTIYFKEFVYQNGKLVFYYIKIHGEQQAEEYRYYYKNDILIKHIESGNTMNGEEAAKKYKEVILLKAKTLQQEFLLGFK
jgi:hypothetical protein